MASMTMGGDDSMSGTPAIGHGVETQYVVNQNRPDEVYEPVGSNGDLLIL